ncbi:MAG: cytochrome c3 family protein [Planctomycetes bacterium]|nr:cytochrome c3 family protein [Planctomycetota bacterium]
MRKRSVQLIGGMMFGVLVAAAGADESVVNSKHDLSVRGPGPIRAVEETRVCIFCHAPHDAAPQTPLWNRENPRTYYRIYESSTTDARIDQPTGSSKMCLSCHDGSMALGNVLSRPATHPIVLTARTMPPGRGDLTIDLSDDHPIGFRYDRALSNADSQVRPVELVTQDLPLGPHAEVHCATCHDPHDNELGDFLRITDQQSAICITCHDMDGWMQGVHATSRKRTDNRAVDPWEPLKYGTVGDNGCTNCHKIHGAAGRERLLRFVAEEDNCLNCHSGAAASFNIAAEIGKRSGHDPRLWTGIHDPAQELFTMRRHVECVSCHNPHAAQPNSIGQVRGTLGQTVKGPTLHAGGVTITGRPIDDARYQYEICLKCHGDSTYRPRLETSRQVTQTNVRLEFQPSNPSFHPVAGPRRNRDVVSLIAPLRVGSVITCTDCHNSDNARFAGGSGANGPHGSLFEPLLIDNYETTDFTAESAEAYALCYRCHDRDSILGDESFSRHRRHIVDIRTPCSVCHDAHGIYRGQGNATNHGNLINFDLAVAMPADTGTGRRVEYEDTGQFSGTCTTTCHGFPHVGFPYANSTAGGGTSRVRTGLGGASR